MSNDSKTVPAAAPQKARREYTECKNEALRVLFVRPANTSRGVVPVIRMRNQENAFLDMWADGVSFEQCRDELTPGTTFKMDLNVSVEPDVAQNEKGEIIKNRDGKPIETFRAYPLSEARDLRVAISTKKAFGGLFAIPTPAPAQV